MAKRKELLLFLLAALVLSVGWALRCYECDNLKTSACGNHFKAYQYSATVCSSPAADIKCGKQEMEPTPEGWVGVIRSCYTPGLLAELNDSLGCRRWHNHQENFTALYCFCDTDYCNRASRPLAGHAASPLTSLLYGACVTLALSACAPSWLAAASGVASLRVLQMLSLAASVVVTFMRLLLTARREVRGREAGGRADGSAGEESQAAQVVVPATLPLPSVSAMVVKATRLLRCHPQGQRNLSSVSATTTTASAEAETTTITTEAEMASDDRGISSGVSVTRSDGDNVLTTAQTFHRLPTVARDEVGQL